jgi:hypothetical protein
MLTCFLECEYQNLSLGRITLASLAEHDRNLAIVFIVMDESDCKAEDYFSESLSVWKFRVKNKVNSTSRIHWKLSNSEEVEIYLSQQDAKQIDTSEINLDWQSDDFCAFTRLIQTHSCTAFQLYPS